MLPWISQTVKNSLLLTRIVTSGIRTSSNTPISSSTSYTLTYLLSNKNFTLFISRSRQARRMGASFDRTLKMVIKQSNLGMLVHCLVICCRFSSNCSTCLQNRLKPMSNTNLSFPRFRLDCIVTDAPSAGLSFVDDSRRLSNDGVKCSNALAKRRHYPNPGFYYPKQ
jgi:hypothetical protein